jgi:glycopeptide antibiotics resistance protein
MNTILRFIRQLMAKMPQIFTGGDMLIFLIVLLLVTFLPVFVFALRKRSHVRALSMLVLVVYILGNLSFTIFNREVRPGGYEMLTPLSDFTRAFHLDYGVVGTVRSVMENGLTATLQSVHIESKQMVREVLLNILLYFPLGYLLPFVFRSLRRVSLITLIGFLCSCATEYAQLRYHIGYFQIDDILTNSFGCFLGALTGLALVSLWRVK